MKSKVLTAAVFALAVAASPSFAGGPTWIGANLGLNMATGDFGDVASTGYFAGATGTMMLNEQFGVGGDLNFHSFGVNDDFEEDLAAGLGESVDVSLSAIQFTPHGKFFFSTSGDFMPYAKLGVGFYNTKAKIEAASGESDDSNTDLGFNLGVGGMFKASDKMAYGVELLYHSIMTEDESSNLFTIGGVLTFGVGD